MRGSGGGTGGLEEEAEAGPACPQILSGIPAVRGVRRQRHGRPSWQSREWQLPLPARCSRTARPRRSGGGRCRASGSPPGRSSARRTRGRSRGDDGIPQVVRERERRRRGARGGSGRSDPSRWRSRDSALRSGMPSMATPARLPHPPPDPAPDPAHEGSDAAADGPEPARIRVVACGKQVGPPPDRDHRRHVLPRGPTRIRERHPPTCARPPGRLNEEDGGMGSRTLRHDESRRPPSAAGSPHTPDREWRGPLIPRSPSLSSRPKIAPCGGCRAPRQRQSPFCNRTPAGLFRSRRGESAGACRVEGPADVVAAGGTADALPIRGADASEFPETTGFRHINRSQEAERPITITNAKSDSDGKSSHEISCAPLEEKGYNNILYFSDWLQKQRITMKPEILPSRGALRMQRRVRGHALTHSGYPSSCVKTGLLQT